MCKQKDMQTASRIRSMRNSTVILYIRIFAAELVQQHNAEIISKLFYAITTTEY